MTRKFWDLTLLGFNLFAGYLTVKAIYAEAVSPERIYVMVFLQGVAWMAYLSRSLSGRKAPRS